MLHVFLETGGLFFWGIVGAVVVFDVFCLSIPGGPDDMTSTSQAMFVTLVVFGFIALFTNVFTGIKLHMFVALLAAYFIVGVIWAFKMWYDYLTEKKVHYKELYVDGKRTESWEAYSVGKMPTAAKNKTRLTSWMILWPFSMTWWITNWPRHVFVWAYNRLTTVFDRMANHIWNS